MKFSDRVDYHTIMQQFYGVLYRKNVSVDFMFPESTDLSGYKVIVVPPLYVASDAMLNKLVEFVRNGGHLVVSFKSGFTNEYDRCAGRWPPDPCGRRRVFTTRNFPACGNRWRSREIHSMPEAKIKFGMG